MRTAWIMMVGTLPASALKNWLLRKVGYDIPRSARFGPCLVVGVGHVSLGEDSRIGPFNVLRDLTAVTLGSSAVLGQWNWISAARPLLTSPQHGTFVLGAESALTSRHYVDASGGVSIGQHTTVAGVRSTFITHGIDWRRAEQTTKSIEIGDYCLISSNVALTPGTRIADRVIVGMGATVSGVLDEEGALYVAPRGVSVKSALEGAYFTRARGFVNGPADRPQ